MMQLPLILAVETTGRIGSVGLAAGQNFLSQQYLTGKMKHSSELLPTIKTLLERWNKKPQDIERLYISIGPGSFTGLRIGVTLAKIMNLANKTKIVPVDTLDVIAANMKSYEADLINKIGVILDAKRGQFFAAGYKLHSVKSKKSQFTAGNFGFEKFLDDSLLKPDELISKLTKNDEPAWLLGEGLLYNKEKFQKKNINILDEKLWSPKAENVHLLGCELARQDKFADPLTLQPNYIRIPEAEEKWKSK